MIYPINTRGLVAFSHEPILSYRPIVLPDGTRPVPKHFDLAAQPHQDVLDRQKEKFDEVLNYLADGEVYSVMRILTWLLELEERQTQATLSCMLDKKLLLAEDLGFDLRLYGIAPAGAASIYPTEVLRTFSKGKTSPNTLHHRLLTQLVRVQLQGFYKIAGWTTDRILVRDYQFPNIPDGVFSTEALAFSAEIELTLKAIQDQVKVLKVYCDMLCEVPDPGAFVNRVVFFTPYIDAMVERINTYVPLEFRHLFFVQYLKPVILSYKRGAYFINEDLANFIGTKM